MCGKRSIIFQLIIQLILTTWNIMTCSCLILHNQHQSTNFILFFTNYLFLFQNLAVPDIFAFLQFRNEMIEIPVTSVRQKMALFSKPYERLRDFAGIINLPLQLFRIFSQKSTLAFGTFEHYSLCNELMKASPTGVNSGCYVCFELQWKDLR